MTTPEYVASTLGMEMFSSLVKGIICADFSNICGVHHKLFVYKFMYIFMLINYSRMSYIVTSVVFADVGIGILIIHHRLYLHNTILCI